MHYVEWFYCQYMYILFSLLLLLLLLYLKTLENDVVSLRESNDEHAVDDAKSHQILCQHSVDHNDHGSNQFKSSAEEKEV